MRATHWIVSIFLATSLCAASAIAAEVTPANGETPSKLEKINGAPASEHEMKDCPMHQGKKEYQHKKGEPCPYHQDKNHNGKAHDKCDYKRPS